MRVPFTGRLALSRVREGARSWSAQEAVGTCGLAGRIPRPRPSCRVQGLMTGGGSEGQSRPRLAHG